MPTLGRLLGCLVLLVLLAIVWVRSPHSLRAHRLDVIVAPAAPPPLARQRAMLGAFRLTGTWQLISNWEGFGGYSALLVDGPGRFLAISDTGHVLGFARPDRPWSPPWVRILTGPAVASVNDVEVKSDRDFESVTRDPRSGRFWIGAEFTNRILRFGPDWRLEGLVAPAQMAQWPINTGAETLVRLRDGRFLVLCECTRAGAPGGDLHPGLLFPRDPVARPTAPVQFLARTPATFAPVDAAQLPDGRLLVLTRTLVWPMPQRFAGRLMIGDPERIRADGVWELRQVASLGSALEGDNFEGLAIEPLPGGEIAVWVIADDNQSRFQRSLLWRLEVDPARL